MKILVTGAKGFVGKNLVAQLYNIKSGKAKNYELTSDIEIYEYDVDTDAALLDVYTADCDFVCHLAGVNRPKDEKEFMEGNFGFTSDLLNSLEKNKNKAPVLITSSIQAALDNPYGKSKKAGEDLIFDYGRKQDVKTLVYRLPNVFGKWCMPNYNSAVATFCNNIASGLPITINDPEVMMNLVYIDDVVDEFISAMCGKENKKDEFCSVPVVHQIKLGKIAELLYEFKKQPKSLVIPQIANGSFEKKLYSTYLSYLPKEDVKFELNMNSDARGSFTELFKSEKCGQVSVNISNPGVTKGQHWHNSKWEFFIVVSGRGLIQERKIGTDEVIEFEVSGEKIEAIHMLPGYTHNIINLSDSEKLITVMWANEQFDPEKPDTYYEEV